MRGRKKITKVIIVFTLIIASLVVLKDVVYANEYENKTMTPVAEDILKDKEVQSELDGLYNYINSMKTDVELLNELDPSEYFKSYIESGEGNLSLQSIVGAVSSFLFREVKVILSLALTIVVIGIICSLLKNLQTSFSADSISDIAFFACYSLLIVILTRSFLISIDLARDIIIKISDFMTALLPILVIMLGAAGGFTQAATMDPIIFGATLIIPKIYLHIIMPLILISFVLQFANNISQEHKIDGLCKLVKQITMWIQGLTLTIFIGLLTIRGITASTIDAVTLKTVKFAIDNFIPIVGGAFSDAITTVAGYSLIIKNAISVVGLVVIVLLMLYPVIKLALMSLVYKLSAALLEPISDKRIINAISSVGDTLVLIMACVISVSVMFFILLGMMASAGKFVIGG